MFTLFHSKNYLHFLKKKLLLVVVVVERKGRRLGYTIQNVGTIINQTNSMELVSAGLFQANISTVSLPERRTCVINY